MSVPAKRDWVLKRKGFFPKSLDGCKRDVRHAAPNARSIAAILAAALQLCLSIKKYAQRTEFPNYKFCVKIEFLPPEVAGATVGICQPNAIVRPMPHPTCTHTGYRKDRQQ